MCIYIYIYRMRIVSILIYYFHAYALFFSGFVVLFGIYARRSNTKIPQCFGNNLWTMPRIWRVGRIQWWLRRLVRSEAPNWSFWWELPNFLMRSRPRSQQVNQVHSQGRGSEWLSYQAGLTMCIDIDQNQTTSSHDGVGGDYYWWYDFILLSTWPQTQHRSLHQLPERCSAFLDREGGCWKSLRLEARLWSISHKQENTVLAFGKSPQLHNP